MGLDITAYRKLTPAPDAEVDEDGYPVDYDAVFQPTANSDFPGRDEGLADRALYTFADSMDFRAGSYGGYNGWREELAQLAGYPALDAEGPRHSHSAGAWAAESGPFWELINFTDCDGVIGPVVSAKLAKDFADFADRAGEHGQFADLYKLWRGAFEMAADGGAVDFH